MSTPEMWFNRATLIKRELGGIDPVTHLPKYIEIPALENWPCDLIQQPKRIAQRSTSGTVYTTVMENILKIYPPEGYIPDESDTIFVDGDEYRVDRVEIFRDAGSYDFRGARLTISSPEKQMT